VIAFHLVFGLYARLRIAEVPRRLCDYQIRERQSMPFFIR
jgi:hypothetical protein